MPPFFLPVSCWPAGFSPAFSGSLLTPVLPLAPPLLELPLEPHAATPTASSPTISATTAFPGGLLIAASSCPCIRVPLPAAEFRRSAQLVSMLIVSTTSGSEHQAIRRLRG